MNILKVIDRTILAVIVIAAACAMLSSLLTGCAPQQPPAPPLVPADLVQAAQPQVTVPPDLLNALPPAVRAAYLSHSDTPIRDGFAVLYPYRPYSEPVVYCSPGHLTEIVLASDETITSAAAGDTSRWAIQAANNHVLIKPVPNGGANGVGAGAVQGQTIAPMPAVYATNLVIESSRRSYHLKLQAEPSRAMELVSFWYPDDIAMAEAARTDAMHKAAQQVADPPQPKLNFNYRIVGPDVPFKPIQAFDDSSHEYIQFANAAALETDLPALYVQQGNTQELVNYQRHGDYYIVDRLYSDAALTEGVGADRQTVRIEAIGAR
jgi:type IV secretion system protein VirB9